MEWILFIIKYNDFHQSTTKPVIIGDDYDDIEAAIPATTLRVDHPNKDLGNSPAKDMDRRAIDNDKQLMPPPSIPLKLQNRYLITCWNQIKFFVWHKMHFQSRLVEIWYYIEWRSKKYWSKIRNTACRNATIEICKCWCSWTISRLQARQSVAILTIVWTWETNKFTTNLA